MKTVIVFLLSAAAVFGTTLTGTLNAPDGSGIDGVLLMSLSQQAALSSVSPCTGPVEVMPTITKRITVIAGAMQGSPAVYGNDCMLPAGTYYNVTVMDNRGNTYFTDKWQITGSSIDVGTIVSLVISGTTLTLGSAGYVQEAPVATQTVVQPGGTYLGINTLAVTATLTLPDGTTCTTGGCIIGSGSNVVLLTTNQTVAGIKTFSSTVNGPLFNCSAAGTSNCLQNAGATFRTTGNGDTYGRSFSAVDPGPSPLAGAFVGLVFNCTATGLNGCIQSNTGTFLINGNGHFLGQAITTGSNNGSIATGGDGASFAKFGDPVGINVWDSGGFCGIGTGEPSPGIACTSDQRLKSTGLDVKSGLNQVMNLRPVTFTWKGNGMPGVGFIAQEVQKVLPNLVTEGPGPDKMLMLSEEGMIPYLVKAVQEQQKEIQTLKKGMSRRAYR